MVQDTIANPSQQLLDTRESGFVGVKHHELVFSQSSIFKEDIKDDVHLLV